MICYYFYFPQTALEKPTIDNIEYHVEKAKEIRRVLRDVLVSMIIFRADWEEILEEKIVEAVKIVKENVGGHGLQRNLRIHDLFFY